MKEVSIRGVTIGRGLPKICLPILGETVADLLSEVNHCLSLPCDIIEWRLDYFSTVLVTQDVLQAARLLRKAAGEIPILATFRTFSEGGVRDLSAADYFALYQALIPHQLVDLIDLELFMPETGVTETLTLAKQHGVKVVISQHDFKGTPSQAEIVRRLRVMTSRGADICKIAVMPHTSDDVLTLLAATNEMKNQPSQVPLVTMAMGKLGLISRLAGEIFGSSLTFGTAKDASAPGQIPAQELATLLQLFHVD